MKTENVAELDWEGIEPMKSCNYCGCFDLMFEEETGREYCTKCGHYTGMVDESYEEYNTLMGEY